MTSLHTTHSYGSLCERGVSDGDCSNGGDRSGGSGDRSGGCGRGSAWWSLFRSLWWSWWRLVSDGDRKPE